MFVLGACGGGDDGGDDDAPAADASVGGPDAPVTPTADAMPGAPDAMPGMFDAGPDAMPTACADALAPIDDDTDLPAGGIPDVIISEVRPGAFVEVYNTTGAAIDLSTPPQSGYYWCNRPFYGAVNTAVTVPARSYAQLPWPGGTSSEASGEYVLYKNSSFGTGLNILDYVCWGALPGVNRNTEATGVDKWSGACAAAIPSGGSLARKLGVAGTSAADYETLATPTPMTCTPE